MPLSVPIHNCTSVMWLSVQLCTPACYEEGGGERKTGSDSVACVLIGFPIPHIPFHSIMHPLPDPPRALIHITPTTCVHTSSTKHLLLSPAILLTVLHEKPFTIAIL